MIEDLIQEVKASMDKSVEAYQKDIKRIRTGRASLALLDGIMVDYYGSSTPINQLATLSIPEARQIVIQPWDSQAVPDIEKAILASDLGITPTNDGKIIRISVPTLTKERRDELTKVARRISEEGKISLRTARRVGNDGIERLEKDKVITEDDKFKHKDRIQKLIDKYTKEIDTQLANKEKEIQEV